MVGVSAAFASLILVFLGILASSYQALLGQNGQATLRRFRASGVTALGVFLLELVTVVVGVSWLVSAGGRCFYVATLVVFFVALASLVGLAVYVTVWVLLRG
jgi:hypothetical protein